MIACNYSTNAPDADTLMKAPLRLANAAEGVEMAFLGRFKKDLALTTQETELLADIAKRAVRLAAQEPTRWHAEVHYESSFAPYRVRVHFAYRPI